MLLSELVKRCQDQNTQAQRLLYERYAGRLFRVAQRYMRETMDAEDILVLSFQKIFEQITGFRYQDEAGTWLWMKTIVVNECLMQLRRSASFYLISGTETREIAASDESVLDAISAETIQTLIAELPVGYRTVFNLVALEGYTHTEVALKLQISEGTSKSQLSKARQLLQKKLQSLGYATQVR